jgi:hypothetical protein
LATTRFLRAHWRKNRLSDTILWNDPDEFYCFEGREDPEGLFQHHAGVRQGRNPIFIFGFVGVLYSSYVLLLISASTMYRKVCFSKIANVSKSLCFHKENKLFHVLLPLSFFYHFWIHFRFQSLSYSEPSWPLWEPTGAQIGHYTLFASPLAQKQIIGNHFMKWPRWVLLPRGEGGPGMSLPTPRGGGARTQLTFILGFVGVLYSSYVLLLISASKIYRKVCFVEIANVSKSLCFHKEN